jgi:hypothetical protein
MPYYLYRSRYTPVTLSTYHQTYAALFSSSNTRKCEEESSNKFEHFDHFEPPSYLRKLPSPWADRIVKHLRTKGYTGRKVEITAYSFELAMLFCLSVVWLLVLVVLQYLSFGWHRRQERDAIQVQQQKWKDHRAEMKSLITKGRNISEGPPTR